MNQDMVGFAYPPSRPYYVSADRIREFARAIGDDNPAYLDGHAAPPTFPIILAMASMHEAFDDPRLGMDFTRVVHGDQRFEYARPVHEGDELVCQTTVDEIRAIGNNDACTLRSVITSHGELVVTSYSKLIVRGE